MGDGQMNERYKVILSNRNLYKEIELSPDMESLLVGTVTESQVRLRKELFFGEIQLKFQILDGCWSVLCSDNLYFDVGDVRKMMSLRLEHGLVAKVCYQNSDHEAFGLEYGIDFDYEEKNYDRRIFMEDSGQVTVGGSREAQIRLDNPHVGEDAFLLKREEQGIVLYDTGCRYGVYVNRERVEEKKEIEDFDFISVVGISFFYKAGSLYTTKDACVTVNGLRQETARPGTTVFKYPEFNRNTRIQCEIPSERIQIQQPVAKPNPLKKSIILTLIPTIVMLAMTIILRGIIDGGGTLVAYSAVSMGMGAIMSVVTYVQDQKKYREEVQGRERAYREYIAEKEALIRKSRDNELRILRLIHPSLEDSIREAMDFGKRLFEKEPEDGDFLKVYLGTGAIESANQVLFSKQEFVDTTDPITMLPAEIAEKYRYMENAPIVVDLDRACGVGIVGERPRLCQMLRNMTLDLAVRHFYRDVKLVYLLDGEYIQEFQWVRWLRNVSNDKLDVRNIVCDEESKNLLLENLYVILSEREAMLAVNRDCAFGERYIVFVTDASMIATYPVSKYVKNCAAYGFTFVFLEEHEEKIPLGCTEIIRLLDGERGEILSTHNGDRGISFSYPAVTNGMAEEAALKLGAIHVDEVTLERQLTKKITMFELLGIISAEDLDLGQRWKQARVHRTLAAPIGVKSDNGTVTLDVSDGAGGHGPHGLVAGTTGSGKSEILQTYILSMATLYHPYEVGFVIIDLKGGGMANQFAGLPHLTGTVTNIDRRGINRAILSIKAEIARRQDMLLEADVNHINDCNRLYKAERVRQPMPHLIMIVDEFAELKAEYPDFMKELITVARIGRILGVHLILATQKPAGVDAQIRSNSGFRLCLKTQTKEDSNEVIKTPLAAEIVEPGRAYFQVGNNEIFELIQSAYSGADVPEGNDAKENVYAVYERNRWGRKKLIYTSRRNSSDGENRSQLEAIVDYIRSYCAENGIEKLPGICLPALKTVIKTDELPYQNAGAPEYFVPIGWYDDPEQQRQGIVELELSRSNVYIVGSAQMGKTTLLQTIAYGLTRKYSPGQVNLYLADCGNRVLKNFEGSRHVGGVVTSNEEEKCRNLFRLLNTLVTERKEIFSEKGVGNFASYVEAGYTDLPLAVLLIDNMAAFREYFPEQAEQVGSLAREAQGVGLSIIITAATSNALNSRIQTYFGQKIALPCNDPMEYGAVFGHCAEKPGGNAGSGLFVSDGRILEFQTAIFGKSAKEVERIRELREYIEERNGNFTDRAVGIPVNQE